MLRAIILDDERMICELIKRLIDWESLDISISGIAYDGLDGLDLLFDEKPDIVVTDIRMPTIDGLEIIKRAREDGIHCYFVVISGYQSFEYAQKAIKYGVTDYLLKPINKEDLTNTLIKIVKLINEEKSKLLFEQQTKDLSLANDKNRRQNFLVDFISSPAITHHMTVNTLNSELKFCFGDGRFGLLIIKADYQFSKERAYCQILLERVDSAFRVLYSSKCLDLETVIIGSRLYCLYQMPSEDSSLLNKQLISNLAEKVENITATYDSISLTICIGEMVSAINELPISLKSAIKSVNYRIIETNNHISKCHSVYEVSNNIISFFPEFQRTKLRNLIELDDRKGIYELLVEIFRPFTVPSVRTIKPDTIYQLCEEIISTVASTLHNEYLTESERPSFESIRESIDNSNRITILVDRFITLLIELLEPYFENKKLQRSRPVRLAIHYVELHYSERITLADIANELNVSPTYFSSMFKAETGNNFVEFLTAYRLDRAKKLLKSSNDSIATIAEMTGFSDAKYFSKVFNKYFGISPNEYRRL